MKDNRDMTSIYDEMADNLRDWYEENRESWWDRRNSKHPCNSSGLADNFMLSLISEVQSLLKHYKIKD